VQQSFRDGSCSPPRWPSSYSLRANSRASVSRQPKPSQPLQTWGPTTPVPLQPLHSSHRKVTASYTCRSSACRRPPCCSDDEELMRSVRALQTLHAPRVWVSWTVALRAFECGERLAEGRLRRFAHLRPAFVAAVAHAVEPAAAAFVAGELGRTRGLLKITAAALERQPERLEEIAPAELPHSLREAHHHDSMRRRAAAV